MEKFLTILILDYSFFLAELVWYSFINERVTVNSRERLSRTSKLQDSVQYNSTGRHLT